MRPAAPGPADEEAAIAAAETLLADPDHRDHPLRAALADLLAVHRAQQERVERLVRISDGYHSLSRTHSSNLTEKFERQVRRLEKLARISDLYQSNLRELTEALRETSLKDPLTELGNRRYLMDRLKEETERARRKDSPLCIALLDVDHFKQINDRHGHDTGDQALCRIAAAIRANVREYDTIGRWGGEEFLLLFPDTGEAEATLTVERVREAIAAIDLDLGHAPPLGLTASIGLTRQRSGETYSATVNRADDALLSAKQLGRNRSVVL